MNSKYKINKSNQRGTSNHGWLKANFSFSFADYYNPERMGFGKLRVLNDDWIQKNTGFPNHSHNDMEIISIIESGEMFHKDSMGNKDSIKPGQIQMMSAGTGVIHSEYAGNEDVESLQIWIEPRKYDIKPKYEKTILNNQNETSQNNYQINKINLIISDELNHIPNTQKINQNTYFSIGEFTENKTIKYSNYKNGNGIFIFILKGQIEFNKEIINKKDSIEIENTNHIELKIKENSKILIIEVEMN
jgi:redox-sensitive bicupin YhaK (pirin superfamily)